ncbi:YCF48-related protein [Conexibacter sp. SYSU D00693]|uniref:WD40/YVTN/BNR-like repeat-containing protein n=1 Tax=Conexibacter sp. SYSU D00693 TaxID=2812560 RepID=UPI00196AA0E0|nr:YCF48-related protein [Conexibacter sp. SYSU D00693]
MSRLRSLGAAAAAIGAMAALAPASSLANVQVGSSGWQWGNPLPQGNTIRATSFFGTRGYAAGDFGTLLVTNDGGNTWNGLPSGTFTALTEVQAVDPDTMVAGGGCVARRTDDGGRTFARIAFTPVESSCKEPLAALAFPVEKTGYVVLADGTVLQTTDGGTEFAQKVAIPGTRSAPGGGQAFPTDARFLTDVLGFVTTSDGKIYRTTDGGGTWTAVNDTQRPVRAITFADATTGYAVGDNNLFLKSTDGGATWSAKDIGGSAAQNLVSVVCSDPQLCIATTAKGDVLIRTADGGTTFTQPASGANALFAAAFATPARVVAGGAGGATVTSDDAGVTFSPVGGAPLTGSFTRIRPGLQNGTAFAPGNDGALAKTVDAGKTWTRSNVPTSENVVDVSFPTATDGYALDAEGGVFRTTTGGGTWRSLDKGTTANPLSIYAPSKDVALLVGPTGIRRSGNGGEAFSAIRDRDVARKRVSGVDRAGTQVVVWGSKDLVRSSDGGRTWKAIRKPIRRGSLEKVDFVNASVGFVLDSVGRVWRTRNGGKRWTELPGVGSDDAYGLAFSSATNGYLVVPFQDDDDAHIDLLMRTSDGGSTWHPQFVVAQHLDEFGIAAPGGGTDYLLGGGSALLASTNGGDQGAASTLTITTKRRTLGRRGRIQVTGKLSPATGVEEVTVAARRPGKTSWDQQTVKVAANGSFTTSWNVTRGVTQFVAQWAGDFNSRGDGSPTLAVRVRR